MRSLHFPSSRTLLLLLGGCGFGLTSSVVLEFLDYLGPLGRSADRQCRGYRQGL